jgi:hypothetical protein
MRRILSLSTGHKVISRLRAAENETSIVLMTGSFSSALLESMPGVIGVTTLAKPFSGSERDAEIDQLIGKGAG